MAIKYYQQIIEYVHSKIIKNNRLKLNNFGKRYKSFAVAAEEAEKLPQKNIKEKSQKNNKVKVAKHYKRKEKARQKEQRFKITDNANRYLL